MGIGFVFGRALNLGAGGGMISTIVPFGLRLFVLDFFVVGLCLRRVVRLLRFGMLSE